MPEEPKAVEMTADEKKARGIALADLKKSVIEPVVAEFTTKELPEKEAENIDCIRSILSKQGVSDEKKRYSALYHRKSFNRNLTNAISKLL